MHPEKNIIFFVGDTHGRFRNLRKAVRKHKPAAVILLGDVQPRTPLQEEIAVILAQTEVWFIHGNHDTDTEADYDNLQGSALAHRNLHGRVVEIAGLRIAGLGGIFREKVWMPPDEPTFDSPEDFMRRMGAGNAWRGGLPLAHRSTIFPSEMRALGQLRADVLVTHEAPFLHPYGRDGLVHLARSMGVSRLYHGHHHDNLDYEPVRQAWGLPFAVHGVGLRGITDQDGQVVTPGELDEQRAHRASQMIWPGHP